MELNRLETHDRYLDFIQKNHSISECCQDLIDKRPFGDHPFYIYAHSRTEDDGVTKRLIWQPRLTKPFMEPNSMLFKGYPGTDKIKIYWILPDKSLWNEYKKKNIVESDIVSESINNYRHHKPKMETPDEDDLSDEAIKAIYRAKNMNIKKSILHS